MVNRYVKQGNREHAWEYRVIFGREKGNKDPPPPENLTGGFYLMRQNISSGWRFS